MNWFMVMKIFSALLEWVRLGRKSEQEKDLEILLLRHQLAILERKQTRTVVEIPIAKTTWVKSRKVWRVFWQRADMKWHSYPPLPEVKSLQEFIDAVEVDEYACFYG